MNLTNRHIHAAAWFLALGLMALVVEPAVALRLPNVREAGGLEEGISTALETASVPRYRAGSKRSTWEMARFLLHFLQEAAMAPLGDSPITTRVSIHGSTVNGGAQTVECRVEDGVVIFSPAQVVALSGTTTLSGNPDRVASVNQWLKTARADDPGGAVPEEARSLHAMARPLKARHSWFVGVEIKQRTAREASDIALALLQALQERGLQPAPLDNNGGAIPSTIPARGLCRVQTEDGVILGNVVDGQLQLHYTGAATLLGMTRPALGGQLTPRTEAMNQWLAAALDDRTSVDGDPRILASCRTVMAALRERNGWLQGIVVTSGRGQGPVNGHDGGLLIPDLADRFLSRVLESNPPSMFLLPISRDRRMTREYTVAELSELGETFTAHPLDTEGYTAVNRIVEHAFHAEHYRTFADWLEQQYPATQVNGDFPALAYRMYSTAIKLREGWKTTLPPRIVAGGLEEGGRGKAPEPLLPREEDSAYHAYRARTLLGEGTVAVVRRRRRPYRQHLTEAPGAIAEHLLQGLVRVHLRWAGNARPAVRARFGAAEALDPSHRWVIHGAARDGHYYVPCDQQTALLVGASIWTLGDRNQRDIVNQYLAAAFGRSADGLDREIVNACRAAARDARRTHHWLRAVSLGRLGRWDPTPEEIVEKALRALAGAALRAVPTNGAAHIPLADTGRFDLAAGRIRLGAVHNGRLGFSSKGLTLLLGFDDPRPVTREAGTINALARAAMAGEPVSSGGSSGVARRRALAEAVRKRHGWLHEFSVTRWGAGTGRTVLG